MSFKNTNLSYSRLTRFETCPLSFKLHYIDKVQASPELPLVFGKMIHAVIERLYREVVEHEQTGLLCKERAFALLQEEWMAAALVGVELYTEALNILRNFVLQQGVVDHRDVLGIEKEFRLQVGPFSVIGFIDRVDQVDDNTIEVVDYKTNHQLFTRDEVTSSLQMSLYQVAAQQLWPWAKNVRLTFHMLRHGVKQTTSRTKQQLDDALRYIEVLGHQTEQASDYPPRLNPNCCYCDHRAHCPAYADALAGRRSFVCSDTTDLEAVAKEREDAAMRAKALYARKEELEKVLKVHLKHQPELHLGGMRYRMFKTTSLEYPLEPTIDRLVEASGLSREEILRAICAVDNKALGETLQVLSDVLPRANFLLLKSELEAQATVHSSPRFWATADKRKAGSNDTEAA